MKLFLTIYAISFIVNIIIISVAMAKSKKPNEEEYKKIFQLIWYCITPIINTIVALLLLMLISVELLSEKLRGDKNAN